MKVLRKNVFFDKIGWPSILISENLNATKKIWLNHRNVTSIVYDYKEYTISIKTTSNEVYEIVCDQLYFSKTQDLIEKYFIRNI